MITAKQIEQWTGLTNVSVTGGPDRITDVSYEGTPPEWFEDWLVGLKEGHDPEDLGFLTDRIAMKKIRTVFPVKDLKDLNLKVVYFHAQLGVYLARLAKGETLTPTERAQANTIQAGLEQVIPVFLAAQKIKEENENPINNPRWP
jgi:hypothetical protein